MKAWLDRFDRFISLFARLVETQERDLERQLKRDEEQRIFLERHVEAGENLASSIHAQTTISKKTADAFERSTDIIERSTRRDGGEDE